MEVGVVVGVANVGGSGGGCSECRWEWRWV